MYKLAWYILDLCNYVDQKCPELFYFIPDYYNSAVFTILRSFIRMDIESLDFLWGKITPATCPKEALMDSFITFISNHLADKRIANPDQQELFLHKLGLLLQYKDLIARMETHPVAKSKLLPVFLAAFEMKSVHLLSRNFLRMLKKSAYNDIQYSVLPDVGSEYYRKQFAELCYSDIKLKEMFLNTFLNHMNNTLTEIKMHCVESGNISLSSREREEHKKEARNFYNVLYDMLRVLETIVALIPHVFLEPNGIFKQRTSDLCMLVIREGIQGQLANFFTELINEEPKRIETQKMILSPIAGIYLNLNHTVAELKEEEKTKYVTVEECIIKSDGFENKLMKTFVEVLNNNGKKVNSKQFNTILGIVNSLEGFIEKHFSPVFLKIGM